MYVSCFKSERRRGKFIFCTHFSTNKRRTVNLLFPAFVNNNSREHIKDSSSQVDRQRENSTRGENSRKLEKTRKVVNWPARVMA